MGDLTQLRREFRDLASESAAEEEQAKSELTASARRFSRRAKHVVDDKLSFSATLMRAGEVGAANRLLEEVEIDVRTEEAALIEKMNEVKIARATTKERMTRVRLARMLAVSLAGSLIMGFSALGMAAAGFVEDREQDEIRRNAVAQRRALEGGTARRTAAAKLRGLDREVRRLLLAGDVPLTSLSSLTAAEIRRIDALTEGDVDLGALQSFLVRVLPTPDLAIEVATKIAGQAGGVMAAAESTAADAADALPAPRVKKRVQRAPQEADSQAHADQPPQEASEPAPSPDQPEPPEEEEAERDGRQQRTGGGDEEDGGEGSGSLPGGQDNPLDGI